jgi:molybdopterin synthase catalytic subunit
MRVRVRYFAAVRERLACAEEWLELPDGAGVGELLERLGSQRPAVRELVRYLSVAVNHEQARDDRSLADGDEVALLPPVAGGAGRPAVLARPLSLDAVLAEVGGAEAGAVVTFTGQVRRHSQGRDVVRIEYEAYGEMAERRMAEIVAEVERAFPGARCAMHHRVGSLAVGEIAVIIAVSAPHRAAAFDGCRMAIEQLKQSVPIWKKEFDPHGGSWVGMGP